MENFTKEDIEEAKNAIERINKLIKELNSGLNNKDKESPFKENSN